MTWLLILTFCIGYVFIAIEHQIRLDKAATALITGIVCWTIYILSIENKELANENLQHHLSDIAGILFFLIGAMTIVELIDLYNGFQIIIDKITTTNKRTFLLIITLLSFFLSALLDNLTTAIVMTSLITKILSEKEDRLISIGMVIIAANAGGAWSPIGDITTTMLWIGHQITAFAIIKQVFVPSVIATLIPFLILQRKMKGHFTKVLSPNHSQRNSKDSKIILITGLSLLVFVPVFKTITHLPPFMGMMFSVGIVWLVSETLHKKRGHESQQRNSIFNALEKIDMPSILFFMGILLAVSALQSVGLLKDLATQLSISIPNDSIMLIGVGLLSSILDNVPLVAAMQGMYSLTEYPTGDFFWELLAYSAGTGGSILIIGSAAGVAAMGIEKISFFWYLKNITWVAFLGFIGGALYQILLHSV